MAAKFLTLDDPELRKYCRDIPKPKPKSRHPYWFRSLYEGPTVEALNELVNRKEDYPEDTNETEDNN
jgi:hypothetical protein